MVPLISLAVGYPKGESKRSDRLPIGAIVHEGKYNDYDYARIKAVYAEKEGLDESAAFIAENGKETLAQVYADVRYPKATNELFSKNLDKFLDETFMQK